MDTLDALMTSIQELYDKKDGSLDNFNAERETISEAITQIAQKLAPTYDFVKVVGRGGAGLVIELRDKQLNLPRALKLPRPLKDELIESVQNEIDHLKSLRHDNLVMIYAAGDVEIASRASPYPFYVMDFVESQTDLKDALERRLETVKQTADLAHITQWLARQLLVVAKAIKYLHASDTVHFDIKPANILVDSGDKAIVTDLGFAKKKTPDAKRIVVGFTLFYAHPQIRTGYEHMSSENRVRRLWAPVDFRFAWDIYAFGRTILQLLARIDSAYPETGMYDYTFAYLHLLACRMLDGRNLSSDESEHIRLEQNRKGDSISVFLEHWLTLQPKDLNQIKFNSIAEVCVDLEKLESSDSYLAEVPELSSHYPHRVQIAATAPAAFSPRVKALVEHPTFIRLRSVKQLGLSDSVYPGCTHSRLEHSIGAYRMCCLYLQALLHDQSNPLFRQLTTTDDLKAVAVASLLHDLGQYPLAHDLEDVAPTSLKVVFKHERLTQKWLESTFTDASKRTVRQIIEDKKEGWGIKLSSVKDLLQPHHETGLPLDPPDIKLRLLKSTIDGPIDVDKLDYLVRDSKRADLPYGNVVDVDRLVRSLTVVLTKDDKGDTLLTLGTYEKGQSAAESVTFARYELYQALYWHHAIRAIRPMLREVLRSGDFEKAKGKTKFQESFESLLGLEGTPADIGVEDILGNLERFASANGRELLNMVRTRRLYKRLLTIHSHHEEEGKLPLLQQFREAQRNPTFDAELQEEIFKRMEAYLASVDGPKPSVLSKDHIDEILAELKKPGRVLSDCPFPSAGSHQKLRFALEPKRRLHNYTTRVSVGERVSEVWQQVYFKLMEIASKGRVYCHPDVRNPLMAALGPEGITSAVKAVVAKF